MSNNEASKDFVLGRIEATVTGTAEDVRAMRTEVGDLARRMTATEHEVSEIKAERAVLMPQYTKFKHDTANEIAVLQGWRHQVEGGAKGLAGVHKYAVPVILFIIGSLLGSSAIRYVDTHPKAPIHQAQSTPVRP